MHFQDGVRGLDGGMTGILTTLYYSEYSSYLMYNFYCFFSSSYLVTLLNCILEQKSTALQKELARQEIDFAVIPSSHRYPILHFNEVLERKVVCIGLEPVINSCFAFDTLDFGSPQSTAAIWIGRMYYLDVNLKLYFKNNYNNR